jgi:hypothetical protein
VHHEYGLAHQTRAFEASHCNYSCPLHPGSGALQNPNTMTLAICLQHQLDSEEKAEKVRPFPLMSVHG